MSNIAKDASAAALEPVETSMNMQWETELTDLLSNLSEAQDELLEVLSQKRTALMKSEIDSLEAIQPREQALIERLQLCQQQRSLLLEQAEREGLPSTSIEDLATALEAGLSRSSDGTGESLTPRIAAAQSRSRILRHHALTNWVLVQRTLLHLSQLVEIIATGGRPEPTYGTGRHVASGGALVDHAV